MQGKHFLDCKIFTESINIPKVFSPFCSLYLIELHGCYLCAAGQSQISILLQLINKGIGVNNMEFNALIRTASHIIEFPYSSWIYFHRIYIKIIPFR